MAVLFGDKIENGWLRVTCIQYQMDSHENGHYVDAQTIPDYPPKQRGKNPVQYYHPENKEWKYEMIDVPWTKEEILQDLAEAVRELTAVIKERK